MIHQIHRSLDGQTKVFLRLCIPRHRCVLVAYIAHHKRQRVVLYADRHLYGLGSLPFEVNDYHHHSVGGATHSLVVKLGIIPGSANAILDVSYALYKDGRVSDLHVAILAHDVQSVMTFSDVLVFGILLQQYLRAFPNEHRCTDTILLRCLRLVLVITD